jgi:hypothetical protein
VPRPRAPPRLEREREEAFECRLEISGSAGLVNGDPKLMEHLVLADNDGVAPDRDTDGVSDRALCAESLAAIRERDGQGQALGIVRAEDVALHAVARFENECSAGQFASHSLPEAVAFHGRDPARMSDECDDLTRGAGPLAHA